MCAAHELGFSHTHYNHAAIQQDPQVLIPLEHLREMVLAGKIGGLAPSVVSYMGYQPDAARVALETAPAIVRIAQREQVDAALLVPA